MENKETAAKASTSSVTDGRQGEVALFIDWENFKRGAKDVLGRDPDLSVIKKTAARHGRIVLARAYANWQDVNQFPMDAERLFKQGIDPLFSGGTKNSADVRMAAECMERAASRQGLDTFVLVTGDRDFIPVVTLLKSRGKRVIVIAVSGHVNAALAYLSDRFFFYDHLVSGYVRPHGDRKARVEHAMEALKP